MISLNDKKIEEITKAVPRYRIWSYFCFSLILYGYILNELSFILYNQPIEDSSISAVYFIVIVGIITGIYLYNKSRKLQKAVNLSTAYLEGLKALPYHTSDLLAKEIKKDPDETRRYFDTMVKLEFFYNLKSKPDPEKPKLRPKQPTKPKPQESPIKPQESPIKQEKIVITIDKNFEMHAQGKDFQFDKEQSKSKNMKAIDFKCPSCGAKLKYNETNKTTCEYCGSDVLFVED